MSKDNPHALHSAIITVLVIDGDYTTEQLAQHPGVKNVHPDATQDDVEKALHEIEKAGWARREPKGGVWIPCRCPGCKGALPVEDQAFSEGRWKGCVLCGRLTSAEGSPSRAA